MTISYMEAWGWIIREWNCPSWKGIREDIKLVLGFDSRVGMCHGQLVSQAGARGINATVTWLNRDRFAN